MILQNVLVVAMMVIIPLLSESLTNLLLDLAFAIVNTTLLKSSSKTISQIYARAIRHPAEHSLC